MSSAIRYVCCLDFTCVWCMISRMRYKLSYMVRVGTVLVWFSCKMWCKVGVSLFASILVVNL